MLSYEVDKSPSLLYSKDIMSIIAEALKPTPKDKYPELHKYFTYSRKYSIRPRFLEDLCTQAFGAGTDLNDAQLQKMGVVLPQWPESRLQTTEEKFPAVEELLVSLTACKTNYLHRKIIQDMHSFFDVHHYLSDAQWVVLEKIAKHYKRQLDAKKVC